MKVEQTLDVQFIRSIVTHPEVFPFAVDEGETPDEWMPPMIGVYWLRIQGIDAVALVYRVSGVIYAYDAAVKPSSRAPSVNYAQRRSYLELVKDWLREHTDCKHLIGIIAADNARSIRAAEADGLKLEGRLPNSKRRGNEFIDAVIYGTGV